ncbi:MAG: hypothetical protein H0V42_11710 [Nocardioidaceae bacterium]|nr:hypothetical protein [Nocardioidaceae bacterium]
MEPASEDRLRYRLGFFYDACYSSVCNQRAADFEWLGLFDDRCSDGFRRDVEERAAGSSPRNGFMAAVQGQFAFRSECSSTSREVSRSIAPARFTCAISCPAVSLADREADDGRTTGHGLLTQAHSGT